MFVDNVAKLPYSDPWNLPLAQRIAMLRRGKKRIAYFYEAPNNSTFRYRAYNMVQVLNEKEQSEVSASYFFLSDWRHIEEIVALADMLVICRSRYCGRINQLVMKFKSRGKRVLFDIDDLVFDPAYAHLVINTLGHNDDSPSTWDFWFAYISRLGYAMRLCDGAITTNDFLAGKIAEYSGLPVKVVPNFINREQLALSDEIFAKKAKSGFARDGRITLGYFSGTPSHILDYDIAVPAIRDVMEENPAVDLMIVGYIDADSRLGKFSSRIQYHPFQDYVNLQRLIASVEYNLMPLQSNIFTDCKSELKYFDAAITGTLSIASPSYTYARAIADGENGYIAKAHEWISVIGRAIGNIDSYAAMAVRAREHARAKYGWHNQYDVILSALGL